MRLRTRWNQKDRARTTEESAGALAFNLWRIACNGVLNLENEGFQTDSQRQRLDVIIEFAAFLLHCADRMLYTRMEDEARQRFMTALALRLLDTIADNMTDALGPGDYREELVACVNERMSSYAAHAFTDEGPGFGFRREFGDRVSAVMGPRDNRWITEQVMDIEVPEAMEALEKALPALAGE